MIIVFSNILYKLTIKIDYSILFNKAKIYFKYMKYYNK